MTQVVEILKQDKDLPIVHSQYHGWEDISSHDIDLVKPR